MAQTVKNEEDLGLIPGLGRPPGEGYGSKSLQNAYLNLVSKSDHSEYLLIKYIMPFKTLLVWIIIFKEKKKHESVMCIIKAL